MIQVQQYFDTDSADEKNTGDKFLVLGQCSRRKRYTTQRAFESSKLILDLSERIRNAIFMIWVKTNKRQGKSLCLMPTM